MWYGMFATSLNGRPGKHLAGWIESASASISSKPSTPSELAAQVLGQPRVELDGDDRGARGQQAACQHSEPRPDLDDVVARFQLGGRRRSRRAPPDRSGSSATGSCRGRSPSAPIRRRSWPGRRRNQALGSERVASRRPSHGSARFGIASRAASARSPASNRNAGGGADHRPVVGAPRRRRHQERQPLGVEPRSPSVARSARLAATPPPSATAADAVVTRRGHRLRGKGVDDRLLERGRDAVDRDRLAAIAIARRPRAGPPS